MMRVVFSWKFCSRYDSHWSHAATFSHCCIWLPLNWQFDSHLDNTVHGVGRTSLSLPATVFYCNWENGLFFCCFSVNSTDRQIFDLSVWIQLDFYSAAALLTMQSAVIATAIPSIRLSVTRWYAIQTNEDRIMRYSLWGSKNTLVFWYQQWLVGDVPFHLKFVLKVTHPLWKALTLTNISL